MATRRKRMTKQLFLGIVCITCLSSTLFYLSGDDTDLRQRVISGFTRALIFDRNVHYNRTIRVLLLRNQNFTHDAPLLQSLYISPHENCVFHWDRDRINQSDAVMMKSELFIEKDEIPERYSPSQKWIFYVWEVAKEQLVPQHSIYDNHFNLTMTYAKDSDIYFPYGQCTEINVTKSKMDDEIQTKMKKKDRLAAWMVSACDTIGQRENYIRDLMRHIPIDVYGECGNRTCAKDRACNTYLTRYKFYLAFENSLCDEYITEKLWKSFEFFRVPVVYGGLEAYKAVLPPHSYIAASDFNSPEQLAKYLLLLDKNNSLYLEYFNWRYTYRCRHTKMSEKSHRVCTYLHRHINEKEQFVLDEMWRKELKKCVNTTMYLANLGVTNLERRPFSKEDVHIYDNAHG